MKSIKHCSGPTAAENLWQVAIGSVTVAQIVCLSLGRTLGGPGLAFSWIFVFFEKWNGVTEASYEKRPTQGPHFCTVHGQVYDVV